MDQNLVTTQFVTAILTTVVQVATLIVVIIYTIYTVPVHKLSVISKVDKTSQSLIEVPVEDPSSAEFIRSFLEHIDRIDSQIISPSKIDPNSPVTIPQIPKLRAIYDELIKIDSGKGRRK